MLTSGQMNQMAQSYLFSIVPLKTLTVPPYSATNTVFYGNEKFIVIDPGPQSAEEQEILAKLVTEVMKDRLFYGIFLTHHHQDHVGSAQFLRTRFNVPIFAHAQARSAQLAVDSDLADSMSVDLGKQLTLQVMHSPGHADDHLVFYDKKHGVLIAGDMITDTGVVLIPPYERALKIYLQNLEKLSNLHINTLVPAHGDPISSNPRRFLLEALQHRYRRILQVLELVEAEQQPLSSADISRIIYKNSVSEKLLPFALMSTESSLMWLKDEGLLERVEHKWQAQLKNSKKSLILEMLNELSDRVRHA
jgi:ribonuclease/clavin/mitogillin